MNRNMQIKQLRCLACVIEGVEQLQPTEAHHLLIGGHAGQKRRGDEYSIPLCVFHHRGDPPEGMTASEATFLLGPSLARSPNRFREAFGLDDELWERTNALLQLETT